MKPLAKAIALSLLALATSTILVTSAPASDMEMPDAFLLRMKPVLDRDAVVSKTTEELERIQLPKFEAHDETLRDILDQLNEVIRVHNSGPSAFHIPPLRICPGHGSEHPHHIPVAHKDASEEKWVPPEDIRLTLNFKPTTPHRDNLMLRMRWLIRSITSLTNTVIDIEPDAIWVKSLTNPESLLTKRTYFIPYSICYTKDDTEYMVQQHIPRIERQYRSNPDSTWDFDEKSHLLTLQFGEVPIHEFEIWFAHELLKHGFKIPGTSSN